MTLSNQPLKKNNNRKYVYLTIAVIGLLTALFFYNRILIIGYYYDWKKNHFSKGDKVYARDVLVNDKPSETLSFFRLAKSTTSSDILVLSTKKVIVNDSLHKYKTACIATYLFNVLVPTHNGDEKGISDMYAVIPNWKMTRDFNTLEYEMPKGYEFYDNNFYIYRIFVTDKESAVFLKK